MGKFILCMLGILYVFCRLLTFFSKLSFLNLSGTLSECQTVLIQFGLIVFANVINKVPVSMKRVNSIL